jgi:DNA modification methylase
MKTIEPIKKPIEAKGHTPQYRMHKYFARRPYNVFSNLINHYSNKNDIVLDCFCGGGVTVFEGMALERKVIGVDINPLATIYNQNADVQRRH